MAASIASVRVKARVVIGLPEGLCEQTRVRQTTNPVIASRATAGKLRPCLLTRPGVLQPAERSEDTSLPRHIIDRSETAASRRALESPRDAENVELRFRCSVIDSAM